MLDHDDSPRIETNILIIFLLGDQQTKHQQVIHSKLLPKFKYFKFGGGVMQPGKKTKNTAPYNTTQYIMYDYSKRLSKEQVCPNGQSQFSNDWNMALAAAAATTSADATKLANFNSPIYINNYNSSSSEARENEDMEFLEELTTDVQVSNGADALSSSSMVTRLHQHLPCTLGAYTRSKSIEIINVSGKEAESQMEDEDDAAGECSKANDILSSSF